METNAEIGQLVPLGLPIGQDDIVPFSQSLVIFFLNISQGIENFIETPQRGDDRVNLTS
jgi:hypothetical protein